MSDEKILDRPFPALTSAQRYHLEVHGYVVVENVLTYDECQILTEALYQLKAELLDLSDPSINGPRVHGSFLLGGTDYHHLLTNIVEVPHVTAYATHPRLVGMAEELLGGEPRMVEMNAQINRRDPNQIPETEPHFSFHRGTDVPFASHTYHGLYHCNFVKTLTNLTDLGPDDGGTVVITGSHKLEFPEEQLIQCAYDDRSLIHQVVAPAGSTLLFSETLIHATGPLRSDKERVIIVTGYGATMFPYWDYGTLSEEFARQIPLHLKTLFLGKTHWTRGARYRRLSDPPDTRRFELGHWSGRSV